MFLSMPRYVTTHGSASCHSKRAISLFDLIPVNAVDQRARTVRFQPVESSKMTSPVSSTNSMVPILCPMA
jgi:hypothetical protein